jgi:parallel beta-helix repeat protein
MLLMAVLLGISLPAFSATVEVGNCLPTLASYQTISLAVRYAPGGSTIKICPGTYYEQVTISKSLTLVGVTEAPTAANPTGVAGAIIMPPSPGGVQQNATDLNPNTFFTPPIAAQIAVLGPPIATNGPITVNISNLIVDGTNNGLNSCAINLVGIYYQNASGTINHNVTRFQELPTADFGCQDGQAIYAQAGYADTTPASVTIENNSVHDYDKNGITVDGDELTATVTANYVVGIGPTSLIAQNGILISDAAVGKINSNVVTDDIYVNASNCTSNDSCASASGILNYDASGTSGNPIVITGNTISNTQGGIVTQGDSNGNADYNSVTGNRVTTSPAAGGLIDGIDLCSNNNTASGNTVFNSSQSGIHIDSSCTEQNGTTGNGSSVSSNTINDACAGVLTGTGSSSASGNTTYNVLEITAASDSCAAASQQASKKQMIKLRPSAGRPLKLN